MDGVLWWEKRDVYVFGACVYEDSVSCSRFIIGVVGKLPAANQFNMSKWVERYMMVAKLPD
jgi:hypothetical protein